MSMIKCVHIADTYIYIYITTGVSQLNIRNNHVLSCEVPVIMYVLKYADCR